MSLTRAHPRLLPRITFPSTTTQHRHYAAPGTGTQTLTAGSKLIAYLTFDSTGGYGTVSSLTYNFDGKTDGTNNGLPAVPEPESYALLLAGLATAALVARRRKA